jgi:dihydrofolate reductase
VERQLIVHMQTTLDLRISKEDGSFWEPFPWGEPETVFVNRHFDAADTWVISRPIYEAVVPWWTAVARGENPDDAADLTAADLELASMIASMRTIAISNTMEGDVLRGDIAAALEGLKAEPGNNIILSCGPATLGPLAQTPGLIDEYLLAVHPAVLAAGPGLFDGVDVDLALELIEAKAFAAGAVVLRYRPATTG